jgi:hypothetical protein
MEPVIVVEGKDLVVANAFAEVIGRGMLGEKQGIMVMENSNDIAGLVDADNFAPDTFNKIMVVKNAESIFSYRKQMSSLNKLVAYLVLQSRQRNTDWILACKNYNKLDKRIQRQCSFIVRIEDKCDGWY